MAIQYICQTVLASGNLTDVFKVQKTIRTIYARFCDKASMWHIWRERGGGLQYKSRPNLFHRASLPPSIGGTRLSGVRSAIHQRPTMPWAILLLLLNWTPGGLWWPKTGVLHGGINIFWDVPTILKTLQGLRMLSRVTPLFSIINIIILFTRDHNSQASQESRVAEWVCFQKGLVFGILWVWSCNHSDQMSETLCRMSLGLSRGCVLQQCQWSQSISDRVTCRAGQLRTEAHSVERPLWGVLQVFWSPSMVSL